MRALGEPGAVLVLLDRHRRDGDAVAARLGIPLHETPFDGVPGTPFEFRAIVRNRFWREVALWWPQERVLVAADALGSLGYFVAPGEAIGLHPFLRPRPPRGALAGLRPEHVLVGHGEGVHGPAAAPALHHAFATARTGIPALAVGRIRSLVGRRG